MRAGMLALAGLVMILDLGGFRLMDRPAIDFAEGVQSFTGYVCGPARPGATGRPVFVFCITGSADQRFNAPTRVRLTASSERQRAYFAGAMRVAFKPRPPRAPLNAGGGGYERWLQQKRIRATGNLVEVEPMQTGCGVICRYHSWRIDLIERLTVHLDRMRHPELAEALLLGSRARLQDPHWEVLKATGTQHLVAISGLHIGLVAMMIAQLVFPLFRGLSPRHPRAARWLPFALMMAGAGFYALLAGLTVPTQRALIMVAVAGVVATGGRQWRLWDAWLIAFVLVVILEPRALWGMGFWFSFAAVACLILAFGARLGRPGYLRGLLVAQVAVVAGLLPLLTAFGAQPSLLAFPTNLVVIPLFSMIVMPLLLMAAPLVLASPGTADWVEPGLDLILWLLWSLLESLAGLDWRFPAIPPLTIVLLTLGALVALMPVGWGYRGLMMAVAAAVMLAPEPDPGPPEQPTELRFPDGFGGPMALVRDGGTRILFDARTPGPRYRERNRDRVLPWLRALDINSLDALVISHPGVRPDQHWRFPDGPVIERVLAPERCERVQRLSSASLHLAGWRDPRVPALPATERACNLHLRYADFEALLFGPIRRSGERRLLRWLDSPGSVDLVLAPRAGANGSSQQGLVQALRPRWAILTPGDWPGGETPARRRYRNAGAQTLLTPATGEIRLRPAASGPDAQIRRARQSGWSLW